MSNLVKNEDALQAYDASKYKTPVGYTSDNVIFTIVKAEEAKYGYELKLMLIKRALLNSEGSPNIDGGKWALPGGFIESHESADEAAKRELEEETGVKDIHIKHFGVYDKEGRDPRGWIISNAHYAVVPEHKLSERRAGDDASEVSLFTIKEVLELPLAFDHERIIQDALAIIKVDMMQTTLAKEFLPKEFILSDLRGIILSVAEDMADDAILNKSFFWQKAPKLPFIEEVLDDNQLPKTIKLQGKRKSALFTFNEESPVRSIYR